MEEKRGRLVLILLGLLVSSIFLSGLVVAQSGGGLYGTGQTPEEFYGIKKSINPVAEAIESVFKVAKPFLSAIFGETAESGHLFAKLLMLILVVLIVWIVLKNVPVFASNPTIGFVVSLLVGFLSTRFLTEASWFNTVLLPYSVLGVALTALIPFVIYFYFCETVIQNDILRKFAWILAFCVFIGLYITRFSVIGNSAWIYFAAALLTLLVLIFDKTIRARMIFSAIKAKGAELDQLQISNLQGQIQQWQTVITNPAATTQQIEAAKRNIKDLQKRIKDILKS